MGEEMKSGALDIIRGMLPGMSEAERKIGLFVLDQPHKALHYNVVELSRHSSSSSAAVVRFCKRIGTKGYNEFKLLLAKDVFRDEEEKFLPDLDLESKTPAEKTVREVINYARESLGDLARTLDPAMLELASTKIREASLTMLFGIGASGIVTSDFHLKLLRIGLPASYTHDSHAQITAACSLKETHVAFIVSYSGETDSMLEVARQAKARRACVITLTMEGSNKLRGYADIPLIVPASERVYRRGAETSRLSQLTVVDILYRLIVSGDVESAIEALERTMEATHRMRRPK
ncbi:MAG TPA: MurR/RpiR family transcriptional regulator [Rectinemataceae bacterium]|nr:MurR/RpiR family transcriptional regulator [Rectinemataceae bacterium]